MSSVIKKQQCIYCGADLEVHEGETLITCPYCDTANPVKTTAQEAVIRRFMLSTHLNKEQAREALVGDLSKLPNSPSDLSTKLTLAKAELKYVPYYLINVRGITEYQGKGRSANYAKYFKTGYEIITFYLKPESDRLEDMKHYTIFAGPQMHDQVIKYNVAARGRQFFDKQEAVKNSGEIVEPVKDEAQARDEAKGLIQAYQRQIVNEEISVVDNLNEQFEIDEISIVFCPIWFLDFKLEGKATKTYTAIIDASNGRTIYTQTPTKFSYYLFLGIMTVIFIALGISGFGMLSVLAYNAIGTFLILLGFSLALEGLILGTRTSFKEKAT